MRKQPKMLYFRIRTVKKPHMYVCALHGVDYSAWVHEKEKEHACKFVARTKEVANNIAKTFTDVYNMECEIEEVSP